MISFHQFKSVVLAAIVVILIAGCSGGGTNPAAPLIPAENNNNVPAESPSVITDETSGVLGVYQVAINPSTYEYEITPSRKLSAIGDIAIPEITKYFLSTPCADCFAIDALGLTAQGNLDIVFKMKHPFQDTTKRKDLDVFDVRGIMILEGTQSFPALQAIDLNGDGFADEPPTGNFDRLINADGYSYHYDSVAQDLFGLDIPGNLNPFRYFFTENNPDPDQEGIEIPWHRMAQGSPFDKKHYYMKIDNTGEMLNFIFVIECSYGQSALFGVPPDQDGSREKPMYFNPEFNQKEAYRILVDPIENVTAGDSGSQTSVTIHIEDWQNSQVPAWNMSDTSSIRYRSNVASVSLSVPGISSALFNKTTPDSGNGTRQNPYVYAFTVTNDQAAAEGEYNGLIAVMDQYQEDARKIQGSVPAIQFTTFTSYKSIKVISETVTVNHDPVAVGSADPNPANHGQSINLIDIDSHDDDPGDSIAKYEWDYDISNGVTFLDSVSDQPNQASTSYDNFTGADKEFTARLRVTDTHNATNTTDVIITVHPSENTSPVAVGSANPNPANHGQRVDFTDVDSYDNDAGDSISKYEWDYVWDGVPGNFVADNDSSIPNQAHTTYSNTTGSDIQFTAGLRVTDQHSAVDYTEVIVTVHTQVTNNNDPIAVANASPNPVTSGRPVSLLDILSSDPDSASGDYITSYKWDVDIYNGVDWDNPDYESTLPNHATHVYSNTGLDPVQFTARLRVDDSRGGWNTDDITITVNPNNLPVAVCNASPNPSRGGIEVSFTDNTSYDPDPTGRIIKYDWDFDYDGVTFDIDSTSTLANQAKHVYQNTGPAAVIFTAALRVTDNSLTTDICTVDVTVEPNNPPVAVGYADPTTIYSGETVTLYAENSYDNDPGDSISKIEWDYEYDGTTFTPDWASNNVNDTTNHIYTNDTGSQIEVTAGLRVYDESNVTDIGEVIITVDPPLPEPIITHDENKAKNNVGKQYFYKSLNINSTLLSYTNGPWDFTQFSQGSSYMEEFTNPATDPDFEQFRDLYPNATCVFKADDTVNGGKALAPRYYDNTPTGFQCELGQENSLLGPDFGMLFTNPVKIPFPMQMGYYEFLVGSGDIGGAFTFTMTFEIRSVGYGMCKTSYGTANCLLMRTYTVFSVPGSGLPDEKYITYEWLADDGRKVATLTSKNFDETTYIPIGMIKGGQLYQQN